MAREGSFLARMRSLFVGSSDAQAAARVPRRPGPRSEYEGATTGRRATGWRRKSTDANAELNPRVQAALRGIAHDLVRNNPFAASAVSKIADHGVGDGITFQVHRNGRWTWS